MSKVPVIVISSSSPKVGKTTLALNLAAALWSDGYRVKLWAPHNKTVSNFMQKRQDLCRQSNTDLPMPELLETISDNNENSPKSVIIAIVPTPQNQQYAEIFAKAHTLISIGKQASDLQWDFSHPYVSLIWEAKKNIASRGIKCLNWIAVLNKVTTEEPLPELQDSAKRMGFRIAPSLYERAAYRYVENGYCAADMAEFRQLFKMAMPDVYARREILTFTDFLWQKK